MSKNKKEVVDEKNAIVEEEVDTTVQNSEIDELKSQNTELNDKLLRHLAEFDNYKKRTHKEKEEMMLYSKSLCIKDILSVVDNFERALEIECKDEEFKKGMEMIFTQLDETLKKLGVCEIESLNQQFNPEIHNAINQVEDENFGENTICQVFQKGYKIGDKVIRHAMVVVANP